MELIVKVCQTGIHCICSFISWVVPPIVRCVDFLVRKMGE